jgi:four helix bundle protein
MKVTKFEELIAWQKAQELPVDVYYYFGTSKDFGFRDQITRAAVSISNNIAEGFERNSDKEFIRFLDIARSSCSEVKSMIYLANRLKFIDDTIRENLIAKAEEVSKIIYGLIKSLQK